MTIIIPVIIIMIPHIFFFDIFSLNINLLNRATHIYPVESIITAHDIGIKRKQITDKKVTDKKIIYALIT